MHLFFTELITKLLSEEVTRAEASAQTAATVPIDSVAETEPLLIACEWALRRANEPNYYTVEEEFRYLLKCLQGSEHYSQVGLESAILGTTR